MRAFLTWVEIWSLRMCAEQCRAAGDLARRKRGENLLPQS